VNKVDELDKSKLSQTVESSPEQLPADHDTIPGLSSPLLGNGGRSSTDRRNSHNRSLSESGERNGTSVAQRRGLRAAFASIIGLVIHAAADGIAMGASAGSGDESLKLIVLFAIMIHKAVSENLGWLSQAVTDSRLMSAGFLWIVHSFDGSEAS
jgi:zinc transporter 9